jgi:hypothetical protein
MILVNDPKISKNDIIACIKFRINEIEKEINQATLDYKASKFAGGESSCATCSQISIIKCLSRENDILKEIMTGYYGK